MGSYGACMYWLSFRLNPTTVQFVQEAGMDIRSEDLFQMEPHSFESCSDQQWTADWQLLLKE